MAVDNNTPSIFDQHTAFIAENFKINAAIQIVAWKIPPDQRAQMLAQKCNLYPDDLAYKKQESPEFFMDLVFYLLCYPAEYATMVAMEFVKSEKRLGFQPISPIVIAAAQSISIYHHVLMAREVVRTAIAQEYDPVEPEILKRLDELMLYETLRAECSAKLVLRSIFMLSGSFRTLKNLYTVTKCDPPIANLLDEELIKLGGLDFYHALKD